MWSVEGSGWWSFSLQKNARKEFKKRKNKKGHRMGRLRGALLPMTSAHLHANQ